MTRNFRDLPDHQAFPWIKDAVIAYVMTGSHAYGTHRPESDEDYRGVCIPPQDLSYRTEELFTQAEYGNGLDVTVFGLRRLLGLASTGNPNILEVVFAEPDLILHTTPVWDVIREHKQHLLSRSLRNTYMGYAVEQIHRLDRHRRWLTNKPMTEPKREDFGLPASRVIPGEQLSSALKAIEHKVSSWNSDFTGVPEDLRLSLTRHFRESLAEIKVADADLFVAAARTLSYSDNFIEMLKLERSYNGAVAEFKSYNKWLTSRNPARKELEAEFGYDTKCAMHAIRLLRTGLDVLESGTLSVRRPDAKELLEIRNGAWTYDQFSETVESLKSRYPEATANSPLPKTVNTNLISDLSVEAHKTWYNPRKVAVSAPETVGTKKRRSYVRSEIAQAIAAAVTSSIQAPTAGQIITKVLEGNPHMVETSVRVMISELKSVGVLAVTGIRGSWTYTLKEDL